MEQQQPINPEPRVVGRTSSTMQINGRTITRIETTFSDGRITESVEEVVHQPQRVIHFNPQSHIPSVRIIEFPQVGLPFQFMMGPHISLQDIMRISE